MGIIICPKHGRAGLVESCAHVGETLDEGLFGNFEKLNVFGTMLLCHRCFDDLGFSGYLNIKTKDFSSWNNPLFERYERDYERIPGRRALCAECVAAAEVADSRRKGKCDPFPVFERTITSNDKATIGEIEDQIGSNFDFRKSIVAEDKAACFVIPGTYRKPLTVKVYYVTDRFEQDKIKSFLLSLLEGRQMNEAKVEFWEAEIWTSWTNDKTGTQGHKRGAEVLLREEYLNCASES